MRDSDVYEALRVVVNECGHSVTADRIDSHLRQEFKRRGEERSIRNLSGWAVDDVLRKLVGRGLAMSFPGEEVRCHPRFYRCPSPTYAPVEETVSERILEIDRQMIALKDEREHLVRVGIAKGTDHVLGTEKAWVVNAFGSE